MPKKSAPAKAAKAAKSKPEKAAKAPKSAKAGAKGAPKDGDEELNPVEGQQLSVDEMEELEEQQEIAASRANGGPAEGDPSKGPEMSASFKNFRHHPDMENFYRFIYENDLRFEALAILDIILADKREKKKLKTGKAAH